MNEIHLNDVGTKFRLTIYESGEVLSLEEATTLEVIFKSPTGTRTVKDAVLSTDGTDGKLEYVLEADVVTVTGRWQVQAHVEIGDGSWYSDITTFTVKPSL